MKKSPKLLIAVGLASAVVGCGSGGKEKSPTALQPPAVASEQQRSLPGDSTFSTIGKGALSGCDLKAARKKIRTAIAHGTPIKLLTVADSNGDPVQSIAKNSKIAILDPAALACEGEITAFVGTSDNMEAKPNNSYNPVELVRQTDAEAGMMAFDTASQPITDVSFVTTELHFDRSQRGMYPEGLADRQGEPYAAALPIEMMEEISSDQNLPPAR